MKRLPLLILIPLLVVVPILAIVRYIYAIVLNPKRAWRIAIGFDQLANVAFNGSEDETISSRSQRAKENGKRWGCLLCSLLDKIDKNHCEKSKGI